MNFSKEYIKECDCKEIQGLRKIRVGVTSTGLVYGDWYFNRIKKKIRLNARTGTTEFMFITWLPTGDQLDDEIVKICEEKNFAYRGYFIAYAPRDRYRADIMQLENSEKRSDNPLIAKIKLLKQLLKDS